MIVNRLQPMRRARRRFASVTFYAQTFQKPARYFCYCPTGLSRGTGWGTPLGGCLVCVLACRVLRAWVRSCIQRLCLVVAWPPRTSWLRSRGRRGRGLAVPSRGCGGVAVAVAVVALALMWRPACRLSLCLAVFFVSLRCVCDTPTNASICNDFCVV